SSAMALAYASRSCFSRSLAAPGSTPSAVPAISRGFIAASSLDQTLSRDRAATFAALRASEKYSGAGPARGGSLPATSVAQAGAPASVNPARKNPDSCRAVACVLQDSGFFPIVRSGEGRTSFQAYAHSGGPRRGTHWSRKRGKPGHAERNQEPTMKPLMSEK